MKWSCSPGVPSPTFPVFSFPYNRLQIEKGVRPKNIFQFDILFQFSRFYTGFFE